ncbi:hypothetical protein J3A83DRAFT_1653407 [Scleroderma citrinum]
MEFVPPNMNLMQLRRKADISGLTLQVGGKNNPNEGRFYVLWRNGNFLVIQAEPFRRPGVKYDYAAPQSAYVEERKAYTYLLEVIQTMLDTIVIDGEKNWAHLVRQKDGTYRLVYTTKRFVQKCSIWTKVIDIDEIEITRFVDALHWEGKDVDLLIGWDEDWGSHIASEINGQKIMHSLGLGHYTFEFLGPVARNGTIVGVVSDAVIGRPITRADRAVVFNAIADIQRHGVLLQGLSKWDLYITDQGVKITNIAAAHHFRDLDMLAEKAEVCHWQRLEKIFGSDMDTCNFVSACRTFRSSFCVIPRLPTPGRPVSLSPEEAVIRWIWSIQNSTAWLEEERRSPNALSVHRNRHQRERRRKFLPPDDDIDKQGDNAKALTSDKPLAVFKSHNLNIRLHPYSRSASKRLVLAEE